MFLREYANKTYDVAPYYFAKLLVDTPIMLLTPFIGTLIVYFSVGLERTAAQFFAHYISLTFCALCSASFGYLLSAMFENDQVATSIAPLFIMPLMLFGGLFTNNAESPPYVAWI